MDVSNCQQPMSNKILEEIIQIFELSNFLKEHYASILGKNTFVAWNMIKLSLFLKPNTRCIVFSINLECCIIISQLSSQYISTSNANFASQFCLNF